jgi:hypothetical protein
VLVTLFDEAVDDYSPTLTPEQFGALPTQLAWSVGEVAELEEPDDELSWGQAIQAALALLTSLLAAAAFLLAWSRGDEKLRAWMEAVQ